MRANLFLLAGFTSLIGLASPQPHADNFLSWCQSNDRGEGFIELAQSSFPRESLEKSNCGKLAEKVRHKTSLTLEFTRVKEAFDYAKLISFFPQLKHFYLITKTPIASLDFGEVPELVAISVYAPLKISEIRSLNRYPNLRHLTLLGANEKSAVSLTGISNLSIHTLSLKGLSVTTAREIESNSSLMLLTLIGVKLDETPRWKAIPNLKVDIREE